MLKNLGNLLLLSSSIFCAGLMATSSLAATSEAESGLVGEANSKTVANISTVGKDKLKVSAEAKTAVAQPPVSNSSTKFAAASVTESQQVVGLNGKTVTNISSGTLAKLKVSKKAEATVAPRSPAIAQPPVANSSTNSATPASALPTSDTLSVDENSEPDTMEQVTSVSELKDVQPTDWAFQALQSMVERYGCISGYPDSTYRGNRALSRYEFAAGLNKCLQQIQKLIAAQPQGVTKEDLATLQRLQEQFGNEIASLGSRLNALETRTAFLENHNFSTTIKLGGEATFSLAHVYGKDEKRNNTVFQDRVFIAMFTSFTGQDQLITTIAAGNTPLYVPGSFTTRTTPFNIGKSTGGTDVAVGPVFPSSNSGEGALVTQSAGNTDNNKFLIYQLEYKFPIGNSFQGFLDYSQVSYFVANTFNPYLEGGDLGIGSISAFGQRSPIYRLGAGSGLGFNYQLTKQVTLTGSFFSDTYTNNLPIGDTNNLNLAQNNYGFFKGGYQALAQIGWQPSPSFGLGLTYVNSYFLPGEFGFNNNGALQLTGTGVANTLAGQTSIDAGNFPNQNPVIMNSYGVEFSFQPSKKFAFNGWFGASYPRLIGSGDGEILYYAVGLAFPDFGKEGNLLGIIVGAEPYLTHFSGGTPQPFKTNIPLHIEAFYQYQVTPNLSITPGFIWLTAPNQDSSYGNDVITAIRTRFGF